MSQLRITKGEDKRYNFIIFALNKRSQDWICTEPPPGPLLSNLINFSNKVSTCDEVL